MQFVYDDGGRAKAKYKGDASDCVCRSIAIATEIPYQEVYLVLTAVTARRRQTKHVRGSHPRTGIHRTIYDTYLKSHGWHWTPTMQIGSGCKVHLRPEELPSGRIIARLSRHLVAIINGVIHDTHDCSRDGMRCVYGYYSQ